MGTDVTERRSWLRATREGRGWSPADLARRAQPIADAAGYEVKFNQQLIWGFENTGKKLPGWFRFAEQALAAPDERLPTRQWAGSKPNLEAGHHSTVPEQPLMRSADVGETASITRLDLSLPMGPGANLDQFIESEPLEFDMAYLRSFTRTPPHRLRLAGGAGDSMFPTLVPNDLVWIDTTQNQLLHSDRIYAASINGGAAIKRLRPVAGGARVLVISDNKTVEPYEVDAGDVAIWGRVIRFARDL